MNNLLFDRLRPIGFTQALAGALDAIGIDEVWPARVTEVQRDTVVLDDGDAAVPARAHPHLLRELAGLDDSLAVGDWVAAVHDAHGDAWIRALLPAATRIARIDGDGRRRVLVANVDLALIVMGLDGDFNPRRVERYLLLAEGAGVWPVVVLTKLDCVTRAQHSIDALRQRLPVAVAIEAVNATAAGAATVLEPYLIAGRTAVLLGSSGAGKSTLTNTLLGRQVQDTGAVRADDSRGRRTHTAPAAGRCLSDRHPWAARASRRSR